MEKKIKIETTRATINIETGSATEMGKNLISNIVSAILNHGYLAGQVVELDRNDEAASLTLEVKSEVYDKDGGYVYEEEPEPATVGGINREASPAWGTTRATDTASAEPEKDDCDCPACQIRRMLTVGLDKAKPGSDRVSLSVYRLGPNGPERIA